MGHAGAIISGGKGTAAEKMTAMSKAGIHVVESPAMIGAMVEKVMGKKTRKRIVTVSVHGGAKRKQKSRKASKRK
jgi:succinyl-CoA synthetase alpha subunit